ncbi:MAG: error-prone DNA polymerase [Syntrophorhabdales bacterium]|jgi:error-prone DNA polymerase
MYIELHAHSNFSLLDGASTVEQLVEAACNAGMGGLALTDHNGLYAAPQFFRAAKEAGIKPVIGAELTLEGSFHITLLVKNSAGYTNLSRLITRAQLAGSKGDPKLTFTDLAERSEGLICLSGCSKGEIASLMLKGKKDEALQAAQKYSALFGPDHFYIELQHHLHPEDAKLCRQLVELAGRLGLRSVATNNVHYSAREDHRLQDILVCIKNRVTLDNSAEFRRPNSEYYFKGAHNMLALSLFPEEAISRTLAIAEQCAFDLNFSSYRFPDFDVPSNETAESYLRELCIEGIRKRYGELNDTIMERLNYEFKLIEGKGLFGYFLIVRDIMEFARKNGILAQGRGSAASSLVAYALGITPVDPIRHKLFVGRFLNEFGIPDIDIDISTNRREEVIQYVYEKYGREHAAMVCTYVTFRARNAVREVGKVLGLPSHILDRMAKSLSSYSAAHAIDDLKEIAEFRGYLGSDAWEHFASMCKKIADFPRHLSIHVGGMIISSKPVSEIVPVEWARAEGRVVCQWDKDGVDGAGLIKVDLLGLRMLSLISDATEFIEDECGTPLDLDQLPMDDPAVYDLITKADTIGVFQVESRAQMQSLPRVKPRTLEDLGVEVAIIRPGPLQGNMVHPYMRRRQGVEPVLYLHPLLEPVLNETLGVILFQEQILQVAIVIAGFTAGEANKLRKAMGRKNAFAELQKWRGRFVAGAGTRGIDEGTANRIFDLIGGFAEFGFCKSHAMSFALLCYRSAFLKKYYPVAFYCALLNNQPMGFYTPEVIIGDAKRHGVTILPVEINTSIWQCGIEKPPASGYPIRLGFRYVKEMGEDRAGKIIAARVRGAFTSLKEFCFRTRLDKESIQNLIAVGAFDGIDRSRRYLLWELGTIEMTGYDGMDFSASERVALDAMTSRDELVADYSIQGFSARRHLLEEYRERLKHMGAVGSSQIGRSVSGGDVRIGGLTVCLQMPPTAKGFAFLTLEDEEGLTNVVLRPDVYRAYRQIVRLEPLIMVEGTIQKEDGVVNLIAKRVVSL